MATSGDRGQGYTERTIREGVHVHGDSSSDSDRKPAKAQLQAMVAHPAKKAQRPIVACNSVFLRELSDLAGDEVRRLLRYTIKRTISASHGYQVDSLDHTHRTIETVLTAFFEKMEDYVDFAVDRVERMTKMSGGMHADMHDTQMVILQRQLRRAISHAREMSTKVEQAEQTDDKMHAKLRELRSQYYREIQHWRSRCGALQMKLINVVGDVDSIERFDDDVTFLNNKDFLGEELHGLIEGKTKELETRRQISEQMLYKQMAKLRDYSEVQEKDIKRLLKDNCRLKCKLAAVSPRTGAKLDAAAHDREDEAFIPESLKMLLSANSESEHSYQQGRLLQMMQSQMDSLVVKLSSTTDLCESFRTALLNQQAENQKFRREAEEVKALACGNADDTPEMTPALMVKELSQRLGKTSKEAREALEKAKEQIRQNERARAEVARADLVDQLTALENNARMRAKTDADDMQELQNKVISAQVEVETLNNQITAMQLDKLQLQKLLQQEREEPLKLRKVVRELKSKLEREEKAAKQQSSNHEAQVKAFAKEKCGLEAQISALQCELDCLKAVWAQTRRLSIVEVPPDRALVEPGATQERHRSPMPRIDPLPEEEPDDAADEVRTHLSEVTEGGSLSDESPEEDEDAEPQVMCNPMEQPEENPAEDFAGNHVEDPSENLADGPAEEIDRDIGLYSKSRRNAVVLDEALLDQLGVAPASHSETVGPDEGAHQKQANNDADGADLDVTKDVAARRRTSPGEATPHTRPRRGGLSRGVRRVRATLNVSATLSRRNQSPLPAVDDDNSAQRVDAVEKTISEAEHIRLLNRAVLDERRRWQKALPHAKTMGKEPVPTFRRHRSNSAVIGDAAVFAKRLSGMMTEAKVEVEHMRRSQVLHSSGEQLACAAAVGLQPKPAIHTTPFAEDVLLPPPPPELVQVADAADESMPAPDDIPAMDPPAASPPSRKARDDDELQMRTFLQGEAIGAGRFLTLMKDFKLQVTKQTLKGSEARIKELEAENASLQEKLAKAQSESNQALEAQAQGVEDCSAPADAPSEDAQELHSPIPEEAETNAEIVPGEAQMSQSGTPRSSAGERLSRVRQLNDPSLPPEGEDGTTSEIKEVERQGDPLADQDDFNQTDVRAEARLEVVFPRTSMHSLRPSDETNSHSMMGSFDLDSPQANTEATDERPGIMNRKAKGTRAAARGIITRQSTSIAGDILHFGAARSSKTSSVCSPRAAQSSSPLRRKTSAPTSQRRCMLFKDCPDASAEPREFADAAVQVPEDPPDQDDRGADVVVGEQPADTQESPEIAKVEEDAALQPPYAIDEGAGEEEFECESQPNAKSGGALPSPRGLESKEVTDDIGVEPEPEAPADFLDEVCTEAPANGWGEMPVEVPVEIPVGIPAALPAEALAVERCSVCASVIFSDARFCHGCGKCLAEQGDLPEVQSNQDEDLSWHNPTPVNESLLASPIEQMAIDACAIDAGTAVDVREPTPEACGVQGQELQETQERQRHQQEELGDTQESQEALPERQEQEKLDDPLETQEQKRQWPEMQDAEVCVQRPRNLPELPDEMEVDSSVQTDPVWDNLMHKVLSWLRLNLFQRQQASMYTAVWEVPLLDEFPFTPRSELERVIEDFEKFLFDALDLQRPCRATDQRRAIRRHYKQALKPDEDAALGRSEEVVAAEHARKVTCKKPECPKALPGTMVPIMVTPHRPTVETAKPASQDQVALAAQFVRKDCSVLRTVAIGQNASSERLRTISKGSVQVFPGGAERRELVGLGVASMRDANALLSNLLGFDVSAATLQGVKQDPLCRDYVTMTSWSCKEAEGAMTSPIHLHAHKCSTNTIHTLSAARISIADSLDVAAFRFESFVGNEDSDGEAPEHTDVRRVNNVTVGEDALLPGDDMDASTDASCVTDPLSARKHLLALPPASKSMGRIETMEERRINTLVTRLAALRPIYGKAIPPSIGKLVRELSALEREVKNNFSQVAAESDNPERVYSHFPLLAQRIVAEELASKRRPGSVENSPASPLSPTVSEIGQSLMASASADPERASRRVRLQQALENLVKSTVQRRSTVNVLLSFAFNRFRSTCGTKRALGGSTHGGQRRAPMQSEATVQPRRTQSKDRQRQAYAAAEQQVAAQAGDFDEISTSSACPKGTELPRLFSAPRGRTLLTDRASNAVLEDQPSGNADATYTGAVGWSYQNLPTPSMSTAAPSRASPGQQQHASGVAHRPGYGARLEQNARPVTAPDPPAAPAAGQQGVGEAATGASEAVSPELPPHSAGGLRPRTAPHAPPDVGAKRSSPVSHLPAVGRPHRVRPQSSVKTCAAEDAFSLPHGPAAELGNDRGKPTTSPAGDVATETPAFGSISVFARSVGKKILPNNVLKQRGQR